MKAGQIARRSWLQLTARAGYVARGLVFIIVAFGLYGICRGRLPPN
jgi:hypothetical protein